jgi:hypothetical protein
VTWPVAWEIELWNGATRRIDHEEGKLDQGGRVTSVRVKEGWIEIEGLEWDEEVAGGRMLRRVAYSMIPSEHIKEIRYIYPLPTAPIESKGDR